jgi:hypothetical protein
VVYIYFEHLQQWINDRRSGGAAPRAAAHADPDATLMMPSRGAAFPAGPHGPQD